MKTLAFAWKGGVGLGGQAGAAAGVQVCQKVPAGGWSDGWTDAWMEYTIRIYKSSLICINGENKVKENKI